MPLHTEDPPFDVLVKVIRPERNLSRQPLFQAALSLQNYPEGQLELPGLTWSWVRFECETTHFDLTLYLYEHCDGFSGEFEGGQTRGLSAVFEYATDLFDAATIQRLAGHFRKLLEEIAIQPTRPIRDWKC